MPYLEELNFKGNPVISEFAYHQQIADVIPRLQIIDDEPIGDSFELFVRSKRIEARKATILPVKA